MTDPTSSYGDPVEEPHASDEDVVGRAEQGLAEAEAARQNPSGTEAPALATQPAAEEPAVQEPAPAEPMTAADDDVEQYTTAAEYQAAMARHSADTEDASPAVTPSEPVAQSPTAAAAAVAPTAAAAPAAMQPIFVQAPEAPNPRGNRAAAGAIGLLAALSFAVLYLAALVGFGFIKGDVTTANVADVVLGALGTWSLWVTVVVFFIAFWLLGAIVNRGRWGAWVIFGLLVGFASYGGYILGELFQAPFWMLTASQGATLIQDHLWSPLAFAAFVIGRELTIWFGAWAAARGRRVTELNLEAQREYERTLEAGPQIVRP
jgi:hypothetical protein